MKKYYILLLVLCLLKISSAQSPKNLTLLDSIIFQGQTLSGCWHYNNTKGKEYALIGASHGIVIVDITNPLNLNQLFQLPGATSQWHEVKVSGDFAYAVSQNEDAGGIKNGMQIIDLRFLPDSAPNKFYYGDSIIANQLLTVHSITTAGNYVYLNGHNITSLGRGVIILDVSDHLFPKYAGAITNRYCHDTYVRGNYIYTSDIKDGLFSIYDISDPSNPKLKATQSTPGQKNHNTWLSDDGNTIFAADESPNAPLAAYDISDFNNITFLDTFYNKYLPAYEVHNVRVKNDFLFNASYGSQLTIVDAARPRNLIEVSNYTTGSSLCWDVDPFTNSGNIIATDMRSRIFYLFSTVFKRASYLEGTVTDSITNQPLSNANIVILPMSIAVSSDFSGVYRTGYTDSGSYNVVVSKANYIPRQLTVSLLNGVLTNLDVKLLPIGTDINELSEKLLNIYPNPANNIIHINSPGFAISKWQILNECGQIVLQSKATFSFSGEMMIDINSFSGGFYTLNLWNYKDKIIRSFVKL